MSERRSPGKRTKSQQPRVKKPEESKKPEVGSTNPDDSPTAERLAPNKLKKLPTENSKLPTEEMEVHHHPEVEKKGFKEYILEGLMIFLAVTMGFFAESLREHVNEHSRAKEFAETLYADIKADTADLHGYIKYFDRGAKSVDTLMGLLSENDPKQIPSGKLYWFGLRGGAYLVFAPHDATLLEMKNSGSLRYFANHTINRELAQYDQLCQSMKTYESYDQGIFVEVRKLRAQLFNFKYNEVANMLSHIKSDKQYKASADSFIKTNPPLLSSDKVVFNEYVEMVRSRFLGRKVAIADTLLNHATGLLGTLKKEYDLDE